MIYCVERAQIYCLLTNHFPALKHHQNLSFGASITKKNKIFIFFKQVLNYYSKEIVIESSDIKIT